jgi:putative transposase
MPKSAAEMRLSAAGARNNHIFTVPRSLICFHGYEISSSMFIPSRHASPARLMTCHRTFFVTSSIFAERSLLQSTRAAKLFLELLYEYRQRGTYLLHEFVIMPDHFHLLITVGSNMTIERAVQFVKSGFAFRAGREFGFRAPVWQKRFSEIRILDEQAFLNARAYIHANPVKRGLALTPTAYEFSSAHPSFELDAPHQWLTPRREKAARGIAKAMP